MIFVLTLAEQRDKDRTYAHGADTSVASLMIDGVRQIAQKYGIQPDQAMSDTFERERDSVNEQVLHPPQGGEGEEELRGQREEERRLCRERSTINGQLKRVQKRIKELTSTTDKEG
jgi:hypothetical protein